MPIDTKCVEKVDLFVAARELPKIPLMRLAKVFIP